MVNLIYLTVLLPLAGFLINGLFGRKIKNEKVIGAIGAGAVGLSFLVVLGAFIQTAGMPHEERQHIVKLFDWLVVGKLNVAFSYQVDQLSLIMASVVTGVGFVIHLYSIGYMHGDKAFWRFFTYLNLFIFAMMNLILADNFLVMFLGWEGVGLCSYLLIGFWYDRKFEKGTTGDAAKKAFVVNRIGDFGFLIGIFLIYLTFNSLNFNEVFSLAAHYDQKYIFELIAIFLFIGAAGKSAQIPLYVWLPDAMAGPTPVSALIHAATMVTAGVYMVARTSIIYAQAPTAMGVVAIVGLLTAFFAATIGLVQNDIKKVLAYSTVSQLGYMFLGLGVGAFTAGIFHVMTHAFFKALLFLGAGSVIHSMHEEQDIRKYGGLKKYMPITYATFFIAALAISGIPPLSGFFSKDEILWNAFSRGSIAMWVVGIITAMMTAFYMFRLLNLTFLGKPRFDEHHTHPHESPKIMTYPLIFLAILSVVGGLVGMPKLFVGEHGNFFEAWLEPIFEEANKKLAVSHVESHTLEIALMVISVIGASVSIFVARKLYIDKLGAGSKIAEKNKGVYNLLLNKYFVDEIYYGAIVNPIMKLSESVLYKFTDVKIIDGTVNGLAVVVEKLSSFVKKLQTGLAQSYAIIMMVGIAITLFWILFSL